MKSRVRRRADHHHRWRTGRQLHRFFGDALIALAGQNYAPPADESAERTAAYVRAFQPGLTAGDLARSTTIRNPWRGHIWKPDGYRQSIWHVLILVPPQPR
jgi:hypothetical protein